VSDGHDQQRFDELADRLEGVVEELDELAFDTLREASAEGERARPVLDKRLTQARRATERAAYLVRQLGRT
jgi:ElaB/YqjD/DUF883 family membrane-anchored ribosome-binding protein